MRLNAVQGYLEGEEMFLANYSDLPLSDHPDAAACIAGVAPTQTFHLVRVEDGGVVRDQVPSEVWKSSPPSAVARAR